MEIIKDSKIDFISNSRFTILLSGALLLAGIFSLIINNGPKIPEDAKDKIFEKFYTTKDQKGSGLGLGIVQNVVSSHQAKITLNSSEKETCFQFSFKLKDT